MDIKVVESTSEILVAEVKGVTPGFLNALRRTMLSQVPKLALEDITIYDNTSALFDEMVAHRLGLLPVPTDLNAFIRRSECTCSGEGCANCTVLFTLSKEGPCTVYSGDLTPAADAKFRIVDPKVPIVKLLEGQRLMLEAGAILGSGEQHAKWQVVNACGYMEYPILKVGQLTPKMLEKVQKTMPEGVVAIEGNTLRILDPLKAVNFLRGMQELFPEAPIEIGREADRWVLRIETDGALAPVVALRKAISLMMEKLKWVEAEVPKLKIYEAPIA